MAPKPCERKAVHTSGKIAIVKGVFLPQIKAFASLEESSWEGRACPVAATALWGGMGGAIWIILITFLITSKFHPCYSLSFVEGALTFQRGWRISQGKEVRSSARGTVRCPVLTKQTKNSSLRGKHKISGSFLRYAVLISFP